MAPTGQNPFCTVMLHIKSMVMKSTIQWCKKFAPGAYLGITSGQQVGFCYIEIGPLVSDKKIF